MDWFCLWCTDAGPAELPENVSDALQLDAGTETVWPRLSEFSIVEDEQLDEVRDRLNDVLTYTDPAGSPLYRFAVKPGEAFRVYSASAIEDPFTLQFSSSEQPIEIDDAGNGTFPEEEGTYALRMMKNYDDAVILTYEAQVVVSADEQERTASILNAIFRISKISIRIILPMRKDMRSIVL